MRKGPSAFAHFFMVHLRLQSAIENQALPKTDHGRRNSGTPNPNTQSSDMSSTPSSNLSGLLLGLAAFGVFATHDIAVKALGGAYAPFQIVFFSVLLGFPLVTVMLLRDATTANLRPNRPWWSGLRTAAAVITGISAFYAFSVLPLAQTYALLFATPLIITLLAVPILGETVGWRRGMAVIVGLVGVMVVLQPGATDFTLGHVAGLTAAGAGALASVIVRKIGREERSAVLMLYPMVANVVVMGAILPFFYKPMPLQDFGLVVVVAVFGFVATLCLIGAYRRADAALWRLCNTPRSSGPRSMAGCSSMKRSTAQPSLALPSSSPAVSTLSCVRRAAAGPPRHRYSAHARGRKRAQPRASAQC